MWFNKAVYQILQSFRRLAVFLRLGHWAGPWAYYVPSKDNKLSQLIVPYAYKVTREIEEHLLARGIEVVVHPYMPNHQMFRWGKDHSN